MAQVKVGVEPTFLLPIRFCEPKAGTGMAWVTAEREARIREIVERVASSEGLELVDIECRGDTRSGLVRIFIDKPEGIRHGDCELVSRQLSAFLDVEDLVPGRYRLEVSSPGLDRKLRTGADYERFAGRKACIELRHPRDGRKQFTGRLRGYEQDLVAMEVGDESVLKIRLDDIAQARLVVEL